MKKISYLKLRTNLKKIIVLFFTERTILLNDRSVRKLNEIDGKLSKIWDRTKSIFFNDGKNGSFINDQTIKSRKCKAKCFQRFYILKEKCECFHRKNPGSPFKPIFENQVYLQCNLHFLLFMNCRCRFLRQIIPGIREQPLLT